MKYQPRMKPQVDAWRYEFGKPIPIWVTRRAHSLKDEEALTITAQGGYLSAAPGNWIARMGDDYFVFTDEEFHAGFEPVPEDPAGRAREVEENLRRARAM